LLLETQSSSLVPATQSLVLCRVSSIQVHSLSSSIPALSTPFFLSSLTSFLQQKLTQTFFSDGAWSTTQLVNNATSLFAWQLTATTQYVGSDSDSNSLASVVRDIRDNGGPYLQRIGQIGLNPDAVSIMIEGRFGCGINQDTANNVVHIIEYARLVFTTQLSYIFDNVPKSFTSLCDNLDHERLQEVYGLKDQADTLFNWICSRSVTGKPTKQIQSTGISIGQENDLIDSASAICAWEFLGVLTTGQVSSACGKDWNAFATNLRETSLNPDSFKKTFCSSDNQKITSESNSIADKISMLATHTLVVQLWALSAEKDLQEFLCHTANFNDGGIKSVGLQSQQFYDEVHERCRKVGITPDA
jgi:hypothetical protein